MENVTFGLRNRAIAAADAEIVEELRARAGISLSSISDLVNTKIDYAEVYPVLVDMLRRKYPVRVREMLVRSLTVKDARDIALPTLLELYHNSEGETTREIGFESFQYALANAIVLLAPPTERETIKQFTRSASFGSSRSAFVDAMRQWRDPEVDRITYDALTDPDLRYSAIVAAGVRRLTDALPILERAKNDQDPDVRRAACKAIDRITGGKTRGRK